MIHKISIAISTKAITNCFPVIKELRTHLEISAFTSQVQRQQQQFNYQLVKRIIDLTIDQRTFKAPVTWLLTEIANAPLLLGREVVFDLFDIKFVQAEERIEFEWRGEKV